MLKSMTWNFRGKEDDKHISKNNQGIHSQVLQLSTNVKVCTLKLVNDSEPTVHRIHIKRQYAIGNCNF
jgi:hypothetical protein